MYANAPHASATTPPSSPIPQQHTGIQTGQVPGHGHGHGHALQPGVVPAHQSTLPATSFQQAAVTPTMTGAYQPSGDAAIDRMLRLEMACKRFGSLI